jgi:putative transcriptional regulator
MILEGDWASFKADSTRQLAGGSILLANPFMEDPNFRRSVVLLVEHSDEHGSMGFIINKPLEVRLSEITLEFSSLPAPLFFGGPVQLDTLHFIHRLGANFFGESLVVKEDIFWGGDIQILQERTRSGEVDITCIRFFVGYSGWSKTQLDWEFENNSWIVTDVTAEQIFDYPPSTMWQEILKNISERHAFIANLPENPRSN